MQLVIAEKPSVAQTIAKVLGATSYKDGYVEGNGYIVSWCVGHLVGLANPETYGEQYKSWSFDTLPIIPESYKFAVNAKTKDQYDVLKKLMADSRVDEIVCATDAGREGECIFRYVYNMAKCKKPFKRLWTSSLEEDAILEGFAKLKNGSEYDNLFAAGFCRAKADWIVGMNASRLFSLRYNAHLNIGRVQTPTLAMIAEREDKIKNFVKEKYFTVEIGTDQFPVFASSERIDDENRVNELVNACNGSSATVKSVKSEKKTVNPPKLYDATTLMREANRYFGFTAQQTLDYTQSLYEQKLVTYPRTDAEYITEDMAATFEKVVSVAMDLMKIQIDNANTQTVINRSAEYWAKHDHHAIIITEQAAESNISSLPDGEQKVLRLIAAKTIFAAAKPHIYETTTAILECAETEFKASGKVVIENGWKEQERQFKNALKNSNEGEKDKTDDEKSLPPLNEGETLTPVIAAPAEHWTSPPKAFNDDTLLSAMATAGNKDYDENSDVEKKGLGTSATRAKIIENLVKREYLVRNKRQLNITDKGVNLISVVPDEVKSPQMTADWETRLQAIERGEESSDSFMSEINGYVSDLVKKYGSVDENSKFASASREREVIGVCPNCGKNVVEFPKSYSCESGKDGCGFVIWKSVSEKSISSTQAKKLLEKRKTDLIKGFTSRNKKGTQFDAYLVLKEDNTVGFEFPPRK
ncbi:MAG: DNA topoisomerase 3 [Oscillospiraceae bacterium]|nr:DNA topoisomerase 3 [Oscillospiraceae bacterium]